MTDTDEMSVGAFRDDPLQFEIAAATGVHRPMRDNCGGEVGPLELLDTLAILGLQISPIEDRNLASDAYMHLLLGSGTEA